MQVLDSSDILSTLMKSNENSSTHMYYGCLQTLHRSIIVNFIYKLAPNFYNNKIVIWCISSNRKLHWIQCLLNRGRIMEPDLFWTNRNEVLYTLKIGLSFLDDSIQLKIFLHWPYNLILFTLSSLIKNAKDGYYFFTFSSFWLVHVWLLLLHSFV
jgi:hypothetical protein